MNNLVFASLIYLFLIFQSASCDISTNEFIEQGESSIVEDLISPSTIIDVDIKNTTQNTEELFILSHFNLNSLALNEVKIYNFLKNYRRNSYSNEKIEKIIKIYLEDYEESSGRVEIFYISTHPLLAFRMMHRFAIDLEEIRNISLEFYEEISKEVEKKISWPNYDSLVIAMEALLRLHFVYDLDLSEFGNGIIKDHETEYGLNSRHCFTVGNFSLHLNLYHALTVEWLEFSKELFLIEIVEGKDMGLDETILDTTLLLAASLHDEKFTKTQDYSDKFFKRRLTRLFDESDKYEFDGFINRMKQRTFVYETHRGRKGDNFNEINFWGLCSGDNYQSEDVKKKLKCWHDFSTPLSPLKIEKLSLEPYIIQIYDVISPSDMDEIIKISTPRMEASNVFDIDSPTNRSPSKSRTSFSAWLNDEEFEISKKVSKIAERVTKLNVRKENAAESLQVASYTFGGHYDFHLDALQSGSDVFWVAKGERIATFMLYLSDVTAGGFTAFTQGGVAARPVKGSAVFWYNLDKSGETDKSTFHGACPLLLGGPKWVANKWIRVNEQFLRRPCPKNWKPKDKNLTIQY